MNMTIKVKSLREINLRLVELMCNMLNRGFVIKLETMSGRYIISTKFFNPDTITLQMMDTGSLEIHECTSNINPLNWEDEQIYWAAHCNLPRLLLGFAYL